MCLLLPPSRAQRKHRTIQLPISGSGGQVSKPLLSYPDARQSAEQKLALAVTKVQMLGWVKSLIPRILLWKQFYPGLSILLNLEGSLPDKAGPGV